MVALPAVLSLRNSKEKLLVIVAAPAVLKSSNRIEPVLMMVALPAVADWVEEHISRLC